MYATTSSLQEPTPYSAEYKKQEILNDIFGHLPSDRRSRISKITKKLPVNRFDDFEISFSSNSSGTMKLTFISNNDFVEAIFTDNTTKLSTYNSQVNLESYRQLSQALNNVHTNSYTR